MKAAAASTASCAATRGVHVRAAVVAVSAVMGNGGSGCIIVRAKLLARLRCPYRTHWGNGFINVSVSTRPGTSGTNEARDGGGGLGQLIVRVVAALGHRTGDAVAQVLVEQIQRHRTHGAV